MPLGLLPGIAADGVDALRGWLTPETIRSALAGWAALTTKQPTAIRSLVSLTTADPFGKASRPKQAERGLRLLGADWRAFVADQTASLHAGDIGLTAWRDRLLGRGSMNLVQSAIMGRGGVDIADPVTARRLAAARRDLEVRLRALSEKHAAGEISAAQLSSYTQSGCGGLLRTAQQMGYASHMGADPVRRLQLSGAEHCDTCPDKAQLYPDLETCIRECGGWPGDGSDDCHGNCLCHIEPAVVRSMAKDLRQLAVVRHRNILAR